MTDLILFVLCLIHPCSLTATFSSAGFLALLTNSLQFYSFHILSTANLLLHHERLVISFLPLSSSPLFLLFIHTFSSGHFLTFIPMNIFWFVV